MATLETSPKIGSTELFDIGQGSSFNRSDALHNLLDVSRLQSGTGVTVTLAVAAHTRSAS
ncbi:hypothetical protein GJQ57_09615 [Ralstonia pickettii]|uniref:Uncharacterized protein n=1 Tax=Ralstonia pickettii TaxID=329 RepID=A0A7X2HM24_RALPI|nr:hypothetical protein [Ralstonia pickettii]MRS98906.1 hypothetical protein [Ralstonia pickettii]